MTTVPTFPASGPLLDTVFAALSDGTRRGILTRLLRGEVTVGELARPLKMSAPAVSKHLRVLEGAGLLRRRVVGRVHHISANPEPLREAVDWIERHRKIWEGSLDRLAALVEENPNKTPVTPKKS